MRVTTERLESRIVLSAGMLDPTFGAGGKAIGETFSPAEAVYALAVQGDKIIVASLPVPLYKYTVASPSLGLARFNANGSLDETFGIDGEATPPLGGAQGTAFAVQPDEKIVVAGDSSNEFVVARYLPDGAVDQTFGQGGSVEFGGADVFQPLAVAIQGDGKIIVGGNDRSLYAGGDQSVVARLLPNGGLDPSFGTGGEIATPDGLSVSAILLQADGKILIDNGNVERLNANGTLDSAFGNGGFLLRYVAVGPGIPMALQSDGKILVVDDATTLYRFNSDGSPDTTFGVGGAVQSPAPIEEAARVIVENSGDIVVAEGSAVKLISDNGGLVRYTPTGAIDETFGLNGFATLGTITTNDAVLLPNGKIIVSGTKPGQNSDADRIHAKWPTRSIVRLLWRFDQCQRHQWKYPRDGACKATGKWSWAGRKFRHSMARPKPRWPATTPTVRLTPALAPTAGRSSASLETDSIPRLPSNPMATSLPAVIVGSAAEA